MSGEKHPVIYAFIDSQNLNLGIQNLGWKLDFKRFFVYLKDKYKVQKAFLFIGYISSYQKLYLYLQKAGYILVFKRTLELAGTTKGNVDAELVLTAAAKEYSNYDKAIIVSGDGDFYCLVDYLFQNKKLLCVLIPNSKKYSQLLKIFASKIEFMDNLRHLARQKK